jgi:protein TonB
MKYFFIAISFFFAVNQMLLAEETVDSVKNYKTDILSDGTVVYLNPDTIASFLGGGEEMTKFITKNLRFPKIAADTDVIGKVYLKMTIDENGKITNITVIRSLEKSYDEEAIQVVRLMPNFIPAKAKGENVASYYIIPIRFTLW